MIVLCKGCLGKGECVPAEVLTIGFPGQCDICGAPDRGGNTAYRTDPRSPFTALMTEVDDICDWLDYEPSLETLEASLRKLNRARLIYHVSKTKERTSPKTVPTTSPE